MRVSAFSTIGRMAQLFDRSRRCNIDNIVGLKEDGQIGIARVDGTPNCYWPRLENLTPRSRELCDCRHNEVVNPVKAMIAARSAGVTGMPPVIQITVTFVPPHASKGGTDDGGVT